MGHRSARLSIAARGALLVLVLVLGFSARAPADGDPPSDLLLAQQVYYPLQPAVSTRARSQLNGIVARAGAAGLRLKIALIASRDDLGTIASLYGSPQVYATFLGRELSFVSRQPLLVVMRAGYGSVGLSPAERTALGRLPPPASSAPDALARSAGQAVQALAHGAGVRISGSGRPQRTIEDRPSLLLLVLILAAGTVAALLLVLRVVDLVRRAQG